MYTGDAILGQKVKSWRYEAMSSSDTKWLLTRNGKLRKVSIRQEYLLRHI